MEKMRDLNFKDFIELVDYLDSATDGAAMSAIGNFIPGMTALQEMEMGYIVDTKDEKAFERFREENPDLDIDPEGRSVPDEKRYWEIKEKALNHSYDLAFNYLKENAFKDESKTVESTQVYNAKTLAALKNMEYRDHSIYPFKRKLFIDKHPELSHREFNSVESLLKQIGVEPSKFMIYVLAYCDGKKYEKFGFFLEQLFGRIEVLADDRELSSQSNKEFLESINTIINKNK